MPLDGFWKMKTFHEKWYAGEVVSVGIGQGAVAVTPIQLARALGGIASGGVLKRPHIVFPDELPGEYRHAMYDSFSGSGDVAIPIDPDNLGDDHGRNGGGRPPPALPMPHAWRTLISPGRQEQPRW